jgi:hypothetical protein
MISGRTGMATGISVFLAGSGGIPPFTLRYAMSAPQHNPSGIDGAPSITIYVVPVTAPIVVIVMPNRTNIIGNNIGILS